MKKENKTFGKLYREMTLINIKKAISASGFASGFKHPVLNGRIKEIFIKDLLEPILYPDMGVCTGVIIDTLGKQSDQIDIIIYDKKVLPPLVLSATEEVIPAESVLATIEVKSTLTKKKLEDSIINAWSVHNLSYEFGDISIANKLEQYLLLQSLDFVFGERKEQMLNRLVELGTIDLPASFIFSFNSDLKRFDEEKRLTEAISRIAGNSTEYVINSLCIADKQTLSLNNNQWKSVMCNEEYENIFSFLNTIMLACSRLSQQRVTLPLDKYLTK